MSESKEDIFNHNINVLMTFKIINGSEKNMDIAIKMLVSYIKLMILNAKIKMCVGKSWSLFNTTNTINNHEIMNNISKAFEDKNFVSISGTEIKDIMEVYTFVPLYKQGITLDNIIIHDNIPYLRIPKNIKTYKLIGNYLYNIDGDLYLNINQLFTEKLIPYVEK